MEIDVSPLTPMSLTDITVAVRMLARYPGLTLVAVLGMVSAWPSRPRPSRSSA
jgi:hypothetical protein